MVYLPEASYAQDYKVQELLAVCISNSGVGVELLRVLHVNNAAYVTTTQSSLGVTYSACAECMDPYTRHWLRVRMHMQLGSEFSQFKAPYCFVCICLWIPAFKW